MKAAVLTEKGIIEFKEVETPLIGENEVLVKLKASALNHRDLWIKKGLYAGIKYPTILGSDGSGVVESVGSDLNKGLIGKEVLLVPAKNWGNSQKCQASNYKILGLPDDGTLAEYIKVETENIKLKPSNLSFSEAAAIPLAGLTAYRALFSRGKAEKIDRILITGIGGGVALFAFQFSLAIGSEVFVTSSSDEKINKAIELGAKDGINYKTENWEKELIKKHGRFDLIIDSACGDDFNKLIDLAENGGRIVFFGGTNGSINNLSPQKIFWKQLSILGSTMGSNEDFDNMLNFINKNNIKPIVDKIFKLVEINDALERMNQKEQFGKIVLENAV